MQKTFFADRTDFSVAEKSGEADRSEFLLDEDGVVVRRAEKIFSATVAGAKAAAVNRRAAEFFFRAREQFTHVLGRRRRVAPLELDGLSRARQRADGEHAGIRIAADEVAHKKITAMKILEVFVDDEADEQIAARLLLVGGRKFLDRVGQHRVGGTVRDLVDQILFDARERPRLADGRAALRDDAGKFHVAADGNRHAAFLEDVAVQINLRRLFGKSSAGEAAENRQRRVGFVPRAQPAFGIEMKRVNEREPAVRALWFDAGLQMPVHRAVSFFNLLLCETKTFQLRAGQGIKCEHNAGRAFNFTIAANQRGARTTREQRNPRVNP